ncbi:hypothetical protein PP175_15210 [Aneurinibacillus sp. Ricciae_BoGa-3]|uniref:hypothetical protein n=1 Tax=Aneurinibacillus sp. Ricciae_BoGa-3 TaxID=3022697 RepID=UPI00233F932E|nr:hypothetical protein [Aneurinibacillus sp. Ricciae_BoGa-3]WCK52772.1 hypothetical protein PP175_15210 [Aneurinibacillus sp. Ricciae_BoGa-3]
MDKLRYHLKKAELYGLLMKKYKYENPQLHDHFYRKHYYHTQCVDRLYMQSKHGGPGKDPAWESSGSGSGWSGVGTPGSSGTSWPGSGWSGMGTPGGGWPGMSGSGGGWPGMGSAGTGWSGMGSPGAGGPGMGWSGASREE